MLIPSRAKMSRRYIPILRWKQGERGALAALSTAGRNNVAPLFLLGTTQYVGRAATKANAAITAPDFFADEVRRIWGTAPIFVDAIELDPQELTNIAAACRSKGLQIIPATTLGAPNAYQSAVSKVMAKDGRGVALRVDLQEMTSAATWTKSWPHSLSDTDLITDFADNIANVLALGTSALQAFSSLHGGQKWRSVTMAGASMPENFTGFQKGAHLIERAEWTLWQKLSVSKLPFAIDFGDYATVSVTPAPEGIAWGFPINVKYTLDQHFLICRGVRTKGINAVPMDQQLRSHALTIVRTKNRNPLAQCWADAKIDTIANGKDAPGGLPGWVKISVNRHVALSRHLLP